MAASRRFSRLHARVDGEILTDADKLAQQLSSVAAEREAIGRLSTWPWDAATVTGFLPTLVCRCCSGSCSACSGGWACSPDLPEH